jgi:DNA excision repair protein ERCC-4
MERLLKQLHVKQLYLYPRFHTHVQSCLDKVQPEVIELTQPLTDSMKEVHAAIIVALQGVLNELKKCLPTLEPSLFTVEEGIFKSHDAKLRMILDPEWYKLSAKTKHLINDLRVVRGLLDILLRYDAVSFYVHLLSLKSSNASAIDSGSSSSRAGLQTGNNNRPVGATTAQPSLW